MTEAQLAELEHSGAEPLHAESQRFEDNDVKTEFHAGVVEATITNEHVLAENMGSRSVKTDHGIFRQSARSDGKVEDRIFRDWIRTQTDTMVPSRRKLEKNDKTQAFTDLFLNSRTAAGPPSTAEIRIFVREHGSHFPVPESWEAATLAAWVDKGDPIKTLRDLF